MAFMSKRHAQELNAMQQQLHNKNDAAFKKFKTMVNDSLNQPDKPVPTNEQVGLIATADILCFGFLL